ncbi:yippee-domain-containing protein, partial [Dothidotthia symphoricarpi CBS 119687]
PFPLYLLPAPFRRRLSSNSSPTTSPSSSPPTPTYFLPAHPTTHLQCQKCLTDLIPTTCIISKGFTGRHGRAYLVSPPNALIGPTPTPTRGGWKTGDIPNTQTHRAVSRQLVTGAHTVSDISCVRCGSVLGWKYVDAAEEAQKYKVGKFILETGRVIKRTLEDGEDEEEGCGGGEEVEFDSQDEDECEDLFSGIWTPRLAGVRRRRKARG